MFCRFYVEYIYRHPKDLIMKQNEIDNIKHSMVFCQMRLKNLKPHIESSTSLNEIYNKVLIEKAVLREKLKQENTSVFEKLLNKFFRKKNKKICDYFN